MAAREALPFFWKPHAAALRPLNAEALLAAGPPGTLYQGLPGNECLQSMLVGHGAFTPAECDRIVALGLGVPMHRGEMFADLGDQRRCRASFLPEADDTRWIFDRVRDFVLDANRRFGFALAGFGEPLHFVEYAEGGHIGWHTDVFAGANSIRKLSVSVQLSRRGDYEGGELEFFPQGVVEEFREQGDLVVFPPYMPHRARPVTRGARHAFVAWVHGPAFR